MRFKRDATRHNEETDKEAWIHNYFLQCGMSLRKYIVTTDINKHKFFFFKFHDHLFYYWFYNFFSFSIKKNPNHISKNSH